MESNTDIIERFIGMENEIHDDWVGALNKVASCNGSCIGPNGEKRACNNAQCGPKVT